MTNEIEELRNLNLEKEELLARKNAIKQKLAEHRDSFTDKELDENTAETRDINEKLKDIDGKIKNAQERAKNQEKEERKNFMEEKTEVEIRSSMEYRKAFMDFVQKGVNSDILQKRTDEFTHVSDAQTVVPETVLAEIIKQSKVSGNILSKVRKLNIKGGVKVPTITLMPTASWIDEDNPSDRKKVTTGGVTFSYFGLEVKLAQSILSEYVSIDAFEAEFAKLAVEAMTNAKEIAIFNGTGSGQPTGILTNTNVTSVNLSAANLVKYDKLFEAISKLGTGYRSGAEFVMAQSTWDKIEGMVDTNGQPVARVNYGFNTVSMSLFGHPVNIVEEDRIKGIDNAVAGTDYIIVYGQFDKYAINSNGSLTVKKYTDEDNNQYVTKAFEVLDGKVLDAKAFIKVKLAS